MKFIPILFSAPMVQAILEGRKTMTRRTIKIDDLIESPDRFYYVGNSNTKEVPRPAIKYDNRIWYEFGLKNNNYPSWVDTCPYGQPGDILWVRESFVYRDKHDKFYYKTDHTEFAPYAHNGWKPSIHMPKSACRIFLEVTEVRVERLQDITEGDSISEGVLSLNDTWLFNQFPVYAKERQEWEMMPPATRPPLGPSPKQRVEKLWQSINGPESWEANPWVWVISFNRIDKPENF